MGAFDQRVAVDLAHGLSGLMLIQLSCVELHRLYIVLCNVERYLPKNCLDRSKENIKLTISTET